MVDPILARDLMVTNFETLRPDETLEAALRKLVALQGRVTEPGVVVVLDGEGRYHGLLTAHLFTLSLYAMWSPPDLEAPDPEDLHQSLLASSGEFLSRRVDEMPKQEVAVVPPDARLLDVIVAGGATRPDFLPVVEAGQVLGLIPVPAVFQAAASLTLTPEHEGIRFDQDD